MIILENLSSIYSPARPCGLTIGNFDGVHLGHQKILQIVREKVGSEGCICVVTFSNHPSHVLSPKNPAPLIYSKSLKLEALKEWGVDVAYCIPFTLELAAKSYDEFLQELMRSCPFDFLILGEGASLGKRREGIPEKITQLGKEMGFVSEYIPKKACGDLTISSGQIRQYIQSGNLAKTAELLGRPFAIEGFVKAEQLIVSPNLCIPPDGEYSVFVNKTKRAKIQIQNHKILTPPFPSSKKVHITFESLEF